MRKLSSLTRPVTLRLILWILVGFALRVIALDGDGLWMDEGYTAWTAHLPWRQHLQATRLDDAPPLYYELQRLLLPHLPPDETGVRLLSVAAGLGSLIWLAAAPPLRASIEAPLAFFALGTHGIYYARQARSYSLLIFLSLVLITATSRSVEGHRRWIVVAAAAEILALYTHNVAVHLVVAANLVWFFIGRQDRRLWLYAQLIVVLAWLPHLLFILPKQLAMHTTLNTWIADYWERVPLALGPVLSLAAFTSGARNWPLAPAERWYVSGPASAILSILALAAAAVLLIAAFRPRPRRETLMAASFAIMPLVSMMLASALSVPSYTVARTDAIAYGGAVLWAALGLRGLPRWGKAAAIAALCATTAGAIVARSPIFGTARENDRRIGRLVAERIHPGDWIVYAGSSRPSIDFYVARGRPGRSHDSIRRFHFPAIAERNPAAEQPILIDSLQVWHAEAVSLRRGFEAEPPERAIFVVALILPGRALEDPTAQDLHYPGNLLAYTLNGMRSLHPMIRLRGDELSADWIVFRLRRDELIPLEGLEGIRVEP